LAMADVFVIPTKDEGRKEGLPIAPLEAMASGCIVLGSDIAGIRDILKDHQDLLFSPGNVEELKHKLIQVMNFKADERMKLQDAMRRTVRNSFNLEIVLKSHENLYQKLIV